MTSIVEFLLARIEDEESDIRSDIRRRSRATAGSSALSLDNDEEAAEQRRTECNARREMVGILQRMMILHDHPSERPQRDSAAQLLKLMAVPYTTHPSYRDDWRP